jgi:Amt family ammonium transporter
MKRFMRLFQLIPMLLCSIAFLGTTSFSAFAQAAAPTIDKGDTAWMLISTTLVLMMLIPGLALFYGGLVRKQNLLAAMMQSLAACCLVSILWVIYGYSLSFTEGTAYLGGASRILLGDMKIGTIASGTSIPESVFIMFQMTFAAITTAILFGSVADRIKFSSVLLLTALWLTVVYIPVAHAVWGPAGFIGGVGVTNFAGLFGFGAMIDFAGGAVVHINAGVAALVAALVLGRRHDASKDEPHNLAFTFIGTSLLWVGWFGFNAGSAVASGERAGMAMLVTQVAAAVAGLTWMLVDWALKGKPSVVGTLSGAVAGLVAITPASGFVNVTGALIIGIAAGVICPWACYWLKSTFKYDDSLDVFGVHGVGGFLGSVLTGVFADQAIGGVAGALQGNTNLLLAQIVGSLAIALYSGVATFVLLKIIQAVVGLRVESHHEVEGIDLHLHGEAVHS